MGKVLNIYGIEIDDSTIYGQTIKRMRENKPNYVTADFFENWVRSMCEIKEDDFLVFGHKTKAENVSGIMYQDLKIMEKDGGIESTMSRIFDSSSIDIEGDMNYFLNSIINSNHYGKYTIIAVLPKRYKDICSIIQSGIVPTDVLAFAVAPDGSILQYGNQSNLISNNKKR